MHRLKIKPIYMILMLTLLIFFLVFIIRYFYSNYFINIANTTIETGKEVDDYFTTKIDDLNLLINDEIVGYIYFGRDTCPVCLRLNTFLESEYAKTDDLLIYKFDTDQWRENEKFKFILEKYNITTVPTLVEIKEDNSFAIIEFSKEESNDIIKDKLENFIYN